MEDFSKYIYGGAYLADWRHVKEVREELKTIYGMSKDEHHRIYFDHQSAQLTLGILRARPAFNGIIYDMDGREKTASDFKYTNYCELAYYAGNGVDVSPVAYGDIPLDILRVILEKIAVLNDPNKRVMFWKLSHSGILDKKKVAAIGDLINCNIDVFRYIHADNYSAEQLKAVFDSYQATKGKMEKIDFLKKLHCLESGLSPCETYNHFQK